jgi:hypothetical protein
MLQLRKKPDIWCALLELVPVARSKSLACIVKKNDELYIGWSDKVEPEAILELQYFKIILLVLDGKPTRSELNDAERTYWSERVRESNGWLN